tara:strand:- start:5114 stop:6442 length:1329 start_codon:yes stop_codon:yes gene_type:complete
MISKKKLLMFTGDVVVFYISFFGALFVRSGLQFSFSWQDQIFSFSILYIAWIIIFFIAGLYDLELAKNNIKFYSLLFKSLIACTIISVLVFYFGPYVFHQIDIAPKRILLIHIIIMGALIYFWRKWLNRILILPRMQENIIIIGNNQKAKSLKKIIKLNPQWGYAIKKIISKNNNKLKKIIQDTKSQTLILTINPHLSPSTAKTVFKCLPLGCKTLNFTDFYERLIKKIHISSISNVWFLENLKNGQRRLYEFGKKSLDLIICFLIAVISAPFCLLIAVLIKWDSAGPIFYRQIRCGKNNQKFYLIKFRTMIQNAEKKGPKWTKKNDSRITKIGFFLRKTRLDELPQIINIIKGEMSLIGPRAERIEFVQERQKTIPFYSIRHIIKPGVTGWAQIKFPKGMMPEHAFEKLQYDLYYIKNRSLILDTGIFLRTIKIVLGMKGN